MLPAARCSCMARGPLIVLTQSSLCVCTAVMGMPVKVPHLAHARVHHQPDATRSPYIGPGRAVERNNCHKMAQHAKNDSNVSLRTIFQHSWHQQLVDKVMPCGRYQHLTDQMLPTTKHSQNHMCSCCHQLLLWQSRSTQHLAPCHPVHYDITAIDKQRKHVAWL
jgi:hypothetical protein